MREILIFAGTTEGRKLSEHLIRAGIGHVLCVATEYGKIVLEEHPLARVHRGRMDQEQIRQFILEGDFLAVVDATHPYAAVVTQNIKKAMEGMDVPYLRWKREGISAEWQKGEDSERDPHENRITCFDTSEACAQALEHVEGNILLTTGSKELSVYCASSKVRERLYVRVLPSMESLSLCMEQGICGKQIIAMQGPFSEAVNEALIRQYGISCLVTKESGRNGGFLEKLEAAERTGTKVFVIGGPKEEGFSFTEICRKLEELCGQEILERRPFQITLAGGGMGGPGSLTGEVRDAVEEADILLGAERMLTLYQSGPEKHPFYLAEQIIPYLEEMQDKELHPEKRKVVILFSGDSGFYSGCRKLRHALETEIREGRLRASLRVLPGISSVAALAARIGESYQDAGVCSMHGKKLPNLIRKIKRNPKTFLLMSGVQDVNRLGELLVKAGMRECEVTVGYQLSYAEEKVRILSPEECCELKENGLYICMVRNPHASGERLTHGMADGDFIRDKVPMTKEEVREVSISKLRLHRGAVVYDIGSGTGSIAVETACLSDEIQVYAVEQKAEAVSLIKRNQEKFQLENITVVEAKAPQGLDALPAATHAFIGGNGGQLKEILAALYRINPGMRVVINAASVETVCEIRECLSDGRMENAELVQVQASRAKKMGSYHLMQAENPVWICAFDFCEFMQRWK